MSFSNLIQSIIGAKKFDRKLKSSKKLPNTTNTNKYTLSTLPLDSQEYSRMMMNDLYARFESTTRNVGSQPKWNRKEAESKMADPDMQDLSVDDISTMNQLEKIPYINSDMYETNAEDEAALEQVGTPKKKGFFSRLWGGIKNVGSSIWGGIKNIGKFIRGKTGSSDVDRSRSNQESFEKAKKEILNIVINEFMLKRYNFSSKMEHKGDLSSREYLEKYYKDEFDRIPLMIEGACVFRRLGPLSEEQQESILNECCETIVAVGDFGPLYNQKLQSIIARR